MGIPPMSDGIPEQIKDYNQHYGEDVFASDGVKIGTFDQLIYGGPESSPYLLVRTGPLGGRFGSDALYVPAPAVEQMGKDRVTLNATTHAIEESGWVSPPLGADRW